MLVRGAFLGMLLGCRPGPGEPGYRTCDPYPAGTQDCVVWVCYEVLDYHRISYTVEWGEFGYAECPDRDCTSALRQALLQKCDYELPTAGDTGVR